LVPRALVVVQVLDEAVLEVRDAADGLAGVVRVAAAPTAAAGIVSQAFSALRNERPRVRLSLREAYSEEAILMAEDGEVDVAVARGPVQRSGLRCVMLIEEPLVLIAASDHPLLCGAEAIRLADLRDQHFVLFGIDSRTALHATVVSACAEAGFVPDVACEGAELMTIGNLVESRVGIALVPRTTALLLVNERIAVREVVSPILKSVLVAATPMARETSPLTAAFLTALNNVAANFVNTNSK
jgi:DNA-binding transcriptional LysR family regulator